MTRPARMRVMAERRRAGGSSLEYAIAVVVAGALLWFSVIMLNSQESRSLERKKGQAAERAKLARRSTHDEAGAAVTRRSTRQFGRR